MAALTSDARTMSTAPLERVSDGVVSFDTEWRFTYINHAAAEYYGRPREELLGHSVWDLYPQARGTDVEQALMRAAETLEPRELEVRSAVFDRMLQVRIYPARDGATVYFLDVTARFEAERALRESEAKYRSLFHNSLEGMAFTAPDGSIYDMNPAGCEMLKRTRDEVVRIGRAGVVDTSDPRLPELLARRARTGHLRAELTMIRGDGTTFPAEIESSVFRDADGNERTCLTFRDLTERNRALTALQLLAEISAAVQSSLSLDAVLRSIATVVVPRLADFAVIDVHDGTRVLRVVGGGSAEEARVVQANAPVRDTPRGVPKVLRTREPEIITAITDEWLQQATQGEQHLQAARALNPVSVIMVPMIARDRIVGVLSLTSLDAKRRYTAADLPLVAGIAERAALAIDNASLYEDAVAARVRRDEMLGVVSHDLRSPLNGIALNAALLERKAASAQLAAIQRQVGQAERLVNDLLAITAIESGKLPLHLTREPLSAMLEELVELHRAAAEDRDITLTTSSDVDIRVKLDRHRIIQALSNLVGNAIKFTPSGGRIELACRREADATVIEVRDNGRGIPADQLPHLFDRFWRGGRTERAEGVGLGLAIAKGVVEAHGGTIEVHSEVGVGTRFSLRLPETLLPI